MDRSEGSDTHVVVLGAGPAGLAAAQHFTAKGVSVTVLEKEDHVGGLCTTHQFRGFRFDLGGHRWFTKNRELHAWFLALMEGELVSVGRTSRIYFEGKYYDYPISVSNVIRNAGPLTSCAALVSYLRSAFGNAVRGGEPDNLRDALTAQFGRRLFEMFFRQYSEKVWGRKCEEISSDWVSQRVRGLSFLGTLRSALFKDRGSRSLIDEFVYPRLGYQRICDRMAEDVAAGGGRVLTSSRVADVEHAGDNDFRVRYGEGGAQLSCKAAHVVSTIPIPAFVRMIQPRCSEEVVEAAKSLKFRDLITVCVLLDKERVTTDTWLYVQDRDLIFARLHEPKNWSEAMVPRPDQTSLVCECFCSRGDSTWQLGDEEIVERVMGDLVDKLGFVRREELLGARVMRTQNAYPIYDLGYRDTVQVLYDFVGGYQGLHLVGRGGTFRYNNADHSIEMGQRAAKRILGEEVDPLNVNTEKEYHEILPADVAKRPPAKARV